VNRQRVAHAIEWAVAALLTCAVVALHLRVMLHAGPLWRDEISSLKVATMPTLAGAWSALVYDPVPALFFVILRAWDFLFARGDDEILRYLGFLIGLGTVGAIWWAARSLRKPAPTWALLLFGLSPVALVWGDSIRAYGLGCVFGILALTFLWRLLSERPRRTDIAMAGAAALCSVHSVFSNSFLLFAAIIGAIVVTLQNRWWRTMRILLAIGGLAALSLLPYASIIRETQNWSDMCRSPITWGWLWLMLFRTTASGGNLAAILWSLGAMLVCGALVLPLVKTRILKLDSEQQNLVVYTGTTFVLGTFANIAFFRWVGWATSLWYYLPLMAMGVFCIEAAATLWRKSAAAIMAQACVITLAAAALIPIAYQATNVRLTNIDLTADEVARHAQPNDLVVVDYYFYAISFQRYYHGHAPWLAVPNLADVSLHRWDLLGQSMERRQPVQSVLRCIDRTLQAGHDVYIVGLTPPNNASAAPPDLPPASQSTFGRILWPYVRRWTSQVAYAAHTHAAREAMIPISCNQPTSTAETIHAFVVSGWKDDGVVPVRAGGGRAPLFGAAAQPQPPPTISSPGRR
jgi:hypothetical protein